MRNQRKSFNKNKKFEPRSFNKGARLMNATEIDIVSLKNQRPRGVQQVTGLIDSVIQTGGPTLFLISDGSGTFTIKAFESAGVRAYPQINEGDYIEAKLTIQEYQGELEGEAISLRKLLPIQIDKVKEDILKRERQRVEVTPVEFMVNNPILEKLKSRFLEVATQIKLAVIKNRPIIIRHHNDADGYSAGYALERAILPLVQEQHGVDKALWKYFSRAPSSAPFYEIEDSIRDSAKSLSNNAKFTEKMPLVIIADNGSSEEDLMPIKQGKIHGIDFIVIDHHFFRKDLITNEVLVHINPFLVGEDGSKYSAGMLCAEIARQISSKVENIDHIPALAGLADRINNPEVMNTYLKIAEKQGYTKELLGNLVSVIDFVSANLRFTEAREYVEVVFGESRKQQTQLVELLTPHIEEMKKKSLTLAKEAAEKDKINKITLQLLDVEATFSRYNYPKPGACVGLLHDSEKQENPKGLITIGILADLITIRATEESHFSVHGLLAYINEKLPEAYADGGGHNLAGAIRFVPSKKAKVIKEIKAYIKTLN